MSSYISIDFGMQNLKVAFFNGVKNFKVDLEGVQENVSKISKNVVYYAEEDGILNKFFFSAQPAEQAMRYNDPDYVRFIKRELQKEHYTRSVCGGKYTFTAVEIVTHIFEQIYFKMNESGFEVTAPVILTVPVVFSEAQKTALKFCAEKAGFSVCEIITEPFASFFFDDIYDECTDDIDDGDEGYVVMFDFGASTLDICLMKITKKDEGRLIVENLSSTGLSYGGKDITDAILPYITNQASAQIAEAIQAGRLDEESKEATFFEIAEGLKNYLYEADDIPEVSDLIYGKKVTLKRTNVDKILDKTGIWGEIKKAIEDMFDATDEFDHSDLHMVSKVVMTGGTSKIQYFRDKMEELFDKADLIGDPNDDDTVYCSVTTGAVSFVGKENVTVRNSFYMHVGIDIGKGFEKVLSRNTFYNVPGKRKQISWEQMNANRWTVKVYQSLEEVGERSDTDGLLFSGYICLNKNLYFRNEDIFLQLKYTHYGIVAVTASAENIKQITEEIPLRTEVSYE